VYDLLESESVSEKWKESILKHQEERKKTPSPNHEKYMVKSQTLKFLFRPFTVYKSLYLCESLCM
jgi:hypothetical protein